MQYFLPAFGTSIVFVSSASGLVRRSTGLVLLIWESPISPRAYVILSGLSCGVMPNRLDCADKISRGIMAVRKRKPGGGRKPGGEFPGKSATFTTRIQPETRRALDEAAKASRPKRSVSAVAEHLLKTGLQRPSGAPRNTALARAVALLAENIEDGTGKNWREDQWTGMALRYAVEALLYHYAPTPPPEGVPAVPSGIEQAAGKMPSAFAEQYRTPPGFGHLRAYNLILEIEQAAPGEINEWTVPIFLNGKPGMLGLIRSGLGLADSKKGKSK
jgi:hypothetical protein